MTTPALRLGALRAAAGLADASLWTAEGALLPVDETTAAVGPVITDVVLASKEVTPGALFACVKGAAADGHDFAGEAAAHGAVALLCERRLGLPLPQLVVPSVREALGPLSAAFWSFPSRRLRVAGVTGTNGKTTTCAILASIFEANGWPAGVIGTLTGQRTTPEAPALQRRFSEMLQDGSEAVAMEVSSHSLVQHRVDGTEFSAAVFTNLSQDHLDYHGTMEEYFQAKELLFTRLQPRVAVVNTADPWGARLAEDVARAHSASVHLAMFSPEDATGIELLAHQSRFVWRGHQFELNLGGRFNIANAVAAATTAVELGIDFAAIAKGLSAVAPVRGRFQNVEAGQPFTVLVDFAHTPAALAEALRAARELVGPGSRAARRAVRYSGAGAASGEGSAPETAAAGFAEAADQGADPAPGDAGMAGTGRVIVVFGAGGGRDRSKRPLMGRAAAELADLVIVTSDNPRNERPEEIIAAIVGGIPGGPALAEPDRAAAIAAAVSMAREGDVLLIAGKGHETAQDFGTQVTPFDDVEVASGLLRSGR